MSQISFRKATPADFEFLNSVNSTCMREHVERVMDWDPDFFHNSFMPEAFQVILFGEEKIGLLQVVREACQVYLGDIMILPEYQNRGHGSSIIANLIQEATDTHLPLRLRVLKGNPAIDLYERLGFQTISEEEHYLCMEKAA